VFDTLISWSPTVVWYLFSVKVCDVQTYQVIRIQRVTLAISSRHALTRAELIIIIPAVGYITFCQGQL